jgi:hypothetical protein
VEGMGKRDMWRCYSKPFFLVKYENYVKNNA